VHRRLKRSGFPGEDAGGLRNRNLEVETDKHTKERGCDWDQVGHLAEQEADEDFAPH